MQSQLNRNWSCSWMLKCQQLLAFKHLLAGEIQRLKVLKQNNNFIFLFCAQLSWEWKKFYNPGARHSMKLANASECGFFPLHLNPYLTLYMLGNFSWFFVVWCFFPEINFSKKFFQEYYKSVKQFGSRSNTAFYHVWPRSKLFAKDYQQTTLLRMRELTRQPDHKTAP